MFTLSLPFQRGLRTVIACAVWCGSAVTAWWLYQQAGTVADAPAIVQVKSYKVGPAQLGRLTSLHVTEGQLVEAGQLIARLDTDLLERQISVAQAQVKQADSEARANDVTLDAGQLQNDRQFQSEIEAAEIELRAAEAEFSRTRMELAKLTDDLKRERDLVRQGLTKTDRMVMFEQHRAGLEEAVRSWPTRIDAIHVRRRAAQSRLDGWRQMQAAGPRHAQRQPAEDRVKERRESVRLLETQMHHTVLRAAARGYVSQILARPGDVLRPGDPVLTLVEQQPHLAVAFLEERRGLQLAPGAQIELRRRIGNRGAVSAVVTASAGDVMELPRRLWRNPAMPSYGRAVYLTLPQNADVNPGELLDVYVHPQPKSFRDLLALWKQPRRAAN